VEHWPEQGDRKSAHPSGAFPLPAERGKSLRLSLLDALQVSARNSREYQEVKEEVFRVALDLDLERNEFRNIFAGLLEGFIGTSGESGSAVSEGGASGESAVARRLKSGAELTGRIALDLIKLLTQDGSSSLGIFADATVSIPLLRGSGKHIVTEPLTQAERNVLYAMWEFERFKKTFAVQVASDYLSVLLAEQEVDNAEQNYRGLITSTRRAQRLAEAGRLPWFQFDQSLQNELRARDRWIRSRESRDRRLDAFKVAMGLPTDAHIELDAGELEDLAKTARRVLSLDELKAGPESVPPADAPVELKEPDTTGVGPLEMKDEKAIELALVGRLDLLAALGRVYDAQRKVVVAADALRGELTLFGSAAVGERRGAGSAELPDADIVFDKGRYAALLTLDLPLERTAERNAYRESYIFLEQAVRDVQGLEDRVKLEVRNRLRSLLESRESITIQYQAVNIAERRVKSTDLFLQAGRADVRDVLESSEALLNAQNALASALVDYRVSELELQRDLGVLEVDETGLWKEYKPRERKDGRS
jgi:outer membrane protein TolC